MSFNIQQQLQTNRSRGVLWLASYPKSGNTWLRAFLTALYHPSSFDINKLLGIYFPTRSIFNELMGIESQYLTYPEIQTYLPSYVQALNHSSYFSEQQFVKIHDAFPSQPNQYISTQNTQSIIYIVRNPLAVVPSFAHHYNLSIPASISILATKNYLANGNYLKKPIHQFPERFSSWSDHVKSWLDNTVLPVHVVRYEDMIQKPFQTFSAIVKALKLQASSEQIQQAIALSSFKGLKKQEDQTPLMRVTSNKQQTFFRSGKASNWQQELSKQDQEKIITNHQAIMERLGYF